MPWGNRAMMLADPDGNRVNLFISTVIVAIVARIAPADLS